jgi:hypothetical protein
MKLYRKVSPLIRHFLLLPHLVALGLVGALQLLLDDEVQLLVETRPQFGQ